MSVKSRVAERGDRLNLFYILESYALNPKTADNGFIVYNGRTTTFHEAYIMVLRYGTWFKNVHGIKGKEIVAIDFMNSSTFTFMLLGLWSIGAVPAFINYNLSGKPLTHSIRTSTARLLVVDEEIRHCFPEEQEKILTSPSFRDGKGPVEIVFHTPEVEAQILGMEPTREDDKVRSGLIPRDMAILIYTSGTTGLPKPAIVSWKKCWSGSLFVKDWLNITSSDRFFTVRTTKFTKLPKLTSLLVHASLP
jgi:Acyl-CoA synthetases (AMP-forming)/AMP-acid ligases II